MNRTIFRLAYGRESRHGRGVGCAILSSREGTLRLAEKRLFFPGKPVRAARNLMISPVV